MKRIRKGDYLKSLKKKDLNSIYKVTKAEYQTKLIPVNYKQWILSMSLIKYDDKTKEIVFKYNQKYKTHEKILKDYKKLTTKEVIAELI